MAELFDGLVRLSSPRQEAHPSANLLAWAPSLLGSCGPVGNPLCR